MPQAGLNQTNVESTSRSRACRLDHWNLRHRTLAPGTRLPPGRNPRCWLLVKIGPGGPENRRSRLAVKAPRTRCLPAGRRQSLGKEHRGRIVLDLRPNGRSSPSSNRAGNVAASARCDSVVQQPRVCLGNPVAETGRQTRLHQPGRTRLASIDAERLRRPLHRSSQGPAMRAAIDIRRVLVRRALGSHIH